MENIQVIQPTKLLAPYIKQYWFLRIEDVKHGFQRSIPAGCIALVFHKGNKIISSFHKGTQLYERTNQHLFRYRIFILGYGHYPISAYRMQDVFSIFYGGVYKSEYRY